MLVVGLVILLYVVSSLYFCKFAGDRSRDEESVFHFFQIPGTGFLIWIANAVLFFVLFMILIEALGG